MENQGFTRTQIRKVSLCKQGALLHKAHGLMALHAVMHVVSYKDQNNDKGQGYIVQKKGQCFPGTCQYPSGTVCGLSKDLIRLTDHDNVEKTMASENQTSDLSCHAIIREAFISCKIASICYRHHNNNDTKYI